MPEAGTRWELGDGGKNGGGLDGLPGGGGNGAFPLRMVGRGSRVGTRQSMCEGLTLEISSFFGNEVNIGHNFLPLSQINT